MSLRPRLPVLLATLLATLGSIAQAPAPKPPQHFTIRLLDGRSGKPFYHDNLYVYLGKGKRPGIPAPQYEAWAAANVRRYSPNKDGNVQVEILRPDADTLSLVVAGSLVCEPLPPADPNLYFSLGEILGHGVVSDNVCGNAKAKPEPGVLIVFVEPRSMWRIGATQGANTRWYCSACPRVQ